MLIDDRHIVTCAHVVDSALKPTVIGEDSSSLRDPIGAIVSLDFPAANHTLGTAEVISGGWFPIADDGSGDIAILRLRESTPKGVSLGPIEPRHRSVIGHQCRVLGFPKGATDGRWAVGVIQGVAGPSWAWQQIDEYGSSRIEQGYSGSPVWDDDLGSIIGIVVAKDRARGIRASYLIPMTVLEQASPVVRSAIAAIRDPRNDPQWSSRYRGVEAQEIVGDYFVGRSEVLKRIAAWIASHGSEMPRVPSICVVTGGPGSGKSAVLARVVVLADEYVRSTSSGDALVNRSDPEAIPPAGCVRVAIDLSGRTLTQVAQELGDSFEYEPGRVADPRQLAASVVGEILDPHASWRKPLASSPPRPTVIVLDAVDEASTSAEIISDIIRPLASSRSRASGIRVLVGTRPPSVLHSPNEFRAEDLLPGVESALILDLDSDEFIQESDIRHYVRRLLLVDEEATTASPYRYNAELALSLSSAIARRAYPNYLVAQLTSRSFAEASEVVDIRANPTLAKQLPASVGQALDRYLLRFGPNEQRVRDLLAPLAWAADSHAYIPREVVWIELANELTGEKYGRSDLRWLLRSSAASFLVEDTVDASGAGYRLYHAALAEHLREWQQNRERETVASVQTRMVSGLLKCVPSTIGPHGHDIRDWSKSAAYIQQYFCFHAAWSGQLDDFLKDPLYLITADLDRLLEALSATRNASGDKTATVLRVAARQLRTCAVAERLSYLELFAHRYGDTELHQAIGKVSQDATWRVRWARSRRLYPTFDITRHLDVTALTVVVHDQATLVVSAGADGVLYCTDSRSGRLVLRPLKLEKAIRNVAAIEHRGHIIAAILTEDGLVIIDMSSGLQLGPSQKTPMVVNERSEQWIEVSIRDGRLLLLYGNSEGTWSHDIEGMEANAWPPNRPNIRFGAATIAVVNSQQCLVGVQQSSIVCLDLADGTLLHEVRDLMFGAAEVAITRFEGEAALASIASRHGDRVHIRRLRDGKLVGEFRFALDEAQRSVCGALQQTDFPLITADASGAIRAWDPDSADTPEPRHVRRNLREAPVYAVASLAGMSLLFGEVAQDIVLIGYSTGIVWGTNLNITVGISGSPIQAISLESGEEVNYRINVPGAVVSAVVRIGEVQNQSVLLVGSVTAGPMLSIKLWNGEVSDIGDPSGTVACLSSFEHETGSIITWGGTGTDRLLQLEFDLNGVPRSQHPRTLIVHPEGRALALASVSLDGSHIVASAHFQSPSILRLMDGSTAEEFRSFDLGDGSTVTTLNGAGRYVLCGTVDGRILVFNIETNSLVRLLEVGFMPTSISLAAPNRMVVTGVEDVMRIDL